MLGSSPIASTPIAVQSADEGSVIASGALSSTGAATAAFTSAIQASGALSSTGTATATFAGGVVVSGALSSTGAATASFVGASAQLVSSPFSASGTSTAQFTSRAIASGALSAAGTGEFLGEGASTSEISLDNPVIVRSDGGGWSPEAPSDVLADLARLKNKRKPRRLDVIKVGKWPDEKPAKPKQSPIDLVALIEAWPDEQDDDEEALMAILALAA